MINDGHKTFLAAFLLALIICIPARGTMVVPEKESCPLCQSEVYLTRLASFGSYIFEEPCKYDLIFPPASYKSFIATCRKCGYSQTVADFLSLSPSQVEKLKSSTLVTSWQPVSKEVPFADRLERAIQMNLEIARGGEFWAFFNRVLIYHFRTLDPRRAARVAKEELDLLKHDPTLRAKERLYLLGEYSRLSGDPAAAEVLFRKAANTSINRELALPLVAANCVCALAVFLVVWRYKRRFFAKVAIAGIVVVLMASVCFYLKNRQPDTYFDEIIEARMALLPDTDEHETTQPNKPEARDGL